MSTTEVAHLCIAFDETTQTPQSASESIIKELSAVYKQSLGFDKIYYGLWEENPKMLQVLIDSETTLQCDETTVARSTILQRIQNPHGEPPPAVQVEFQPPESLRHALEAPITEFATFYFDGEPNVDWLENAGKAAAWLEREAPGFRHMAYGVSDQSVEYKGVVGKAAMIAVGWESKEAHIRFWDFPSFKENVWLLKGTMKANEMHHVQITEAQ